tara:strand:- start:1998 stop:2576 length:579 start_codon:yes stop_codon:yes gene_type:complete
MQQEPALRFDEESHTYYLNDRKIPSVTQIMSEILGQPFFATEWHMQRGSAVHAYAELIAKGVTFDRPDERIAGRIEACKKFHAEVVQEVIEVEKKYASVRYQYAGTGDLLMRNDGVTYLADYKGTLTKQTEIQLGAYGILTGARKGFGIQLNDDGTYKMSDIYELKRPGQEFLNLLSAYNTKARLGMIKKEK